MTGIILSSDLKEATNIKQICLDSETSLDILDTCQSVTALSKYSSKNIEVILANTAIIAEDSKNVLLSFLEQNDIEIIFYSSNKQTALKIWPFFPIAFLIYPFSKQDLQNALHRLSKRSAKKDPGFSKTLQALLKKNKIALPITEGFILVKPQEIVRCEAQGGYTQVFLKDESSLLITKTLKHYDEILEDFNFFRIHKSHLVNLKYVRKFIKGKQGYIEIADGKIIEVSSRKREDLLYQLSVMA